MNRYPSVAFKNETQSRTAEFVALLDIVLPDGSTGYVSDRELTVSISGSSRTYVRKLKGFSGITQNIDGGNSSATFTLANIDRIFEIACRDHVFIRGKVTFRLFAPKVYSGGGSFDESSHIFYVGYISNVNYDTQEFSIQCKDGFYSLSLPFPRARFSRACRNQFDDGCFCPYSGYATQQRRGDDGVPIAGDFVSISSLTGVVGPSGETFVAGGGGVGNGSSDFGPAPDFGGPVEGREGVAARPGYTDCPKTFEGCFLRGMHRFFTGLRYVASWAGGYTQRGMISRMLGFGGDYFTSVSTANDSIYNTAIPMLYCSQADMPQSPLTGEFPLYGFITTPILFQWRYESTFTSVEGVVSLGRIGKASDSQYGAVLNPSSSRRGEDVEGVREIYVNGLQPHNGQFPRFPGVGVFRSSGRIGEPAALPVFSSRSDNDPTSSLNHIATVLGHPDYTSWDQIGGDLQQGSTWVNPITSAVEQQPVIWLSQLSGFFARVFDVNSGINNPQVYNTQMAGGDSTKYSGKGTPDVRARISNGRYMWVYSPSSRVYKPYSNPAWIFLDVFLETNARKYASRSDHETLVDLQTFMDWGSYCFDDVLNSVNPVYSAKRYLWSGVFNEIRPASDCLDAILKDTYSVRFWRKGKLAVRPRAAGNFTSDHNPRPAFQEFVNIIDGSLKSSIPQPKFNQLQLNFADIDFDFQKNTSTVYSESHQLFMGEGANRLELSKSENLTGTPTTDQAVRLGSRWLKDEIGGADQDRWGRLREIELKSTLMMGELEIGDITYVSHTLVPNGGDWFIVTSWSLSDDLSITYKLRTFRIENYDDTLTGLSSTDLAQFGYNPFIPGSGGITYAPLPAVKWADDVSPIVDRGVQAISNLGIRLRWLPYTADSSITSSQQELLDRLTLSMQIYRTPAVTLRDSLESGDSIMSVKYTLHLPQAPFILRFDDASDVTGNSFELVNVISVNHDTRQLEVTRNYTGSSSVAVYHEKGEIAYSRLFAGGFLGSNVLTEDTTFIVDKDTADFNVGEKYSVNGEIIKVTSITVHTTYIEIEVLRAQKRNDDDPNEVYQDPQPHHKFSQVQHINFLDATPDFRQRQFGSEGVYSYVDPLADSSNILTASTTTTTTSTTTT